MTRPSRREMRSGYTTGACAAAAARAAAMGLLDGAIPATVETLLPNGQRVIFPVSDPMLTPKLARAGIIKDGGSGPDVTHGAMIRATVEPLLHAPHTLRLEAGEGVGRVTRPGLEIPVGEAAINPVPRRNIADNLREVAQGWLAEHGLKVTFSVPGGEALAQRTLNPRLGIVGGISLLGVSGIAHPYSSAAYRATVEQGVRVAAHQGMPAVVLTTGGRTERFAMGLLPHLPPVAFVQMGDFIGAALKAISQYGPPRVIVAGMAGKLVKMAEGRANTHAGKGSVDPGFLVELAQALGFSQPERLAEANTVRHGVEILAQEGLDRAFYPLLLERVRAALARRLPPQTAVSVAAFDFDGGLAATLGDEPWNPSVG